MAIIVGEEIGGFRFKFAQYFLKHLSSSPVPDKRIKRFEGHFQLNNHSHQILLLAKQWFVTLPGQLLGGLKCNFSTTRIRRIKGL